MAFSSGLVCSPRQKYYRSRNDRTRQEHGPNLRLNRVFRAGPWPCTFVPATMTELLSPRINSALLPEYIGRKVRLTCKVLKVRGGSTHARVRYLTRPSPPIRRTRLSSYRRRTAGRSKAKLSRRYVVTPFAGAVD